MSRSWDKQYSFNDDLWVFLTFPIHIGMISLYIIPFVMILLLIDYGVLKNLSMPNWLGWVIIGGMGIWASLVTPRIIKKIYVKFGILKDKRMES